MGGCGSAGSHSLRHVGVVPRRDVGVGGVNLAEPAGAGRLDGEDVVALRSALGAGLVDAPVAVAPSPPPPGPRRWSWTKASRCKRPCPRAWPGSRPGRASGRRWRSARRRCRVRSARNSRISGYILQSLLPYWSSTIFLTASPPLPSGGRRWRRTARPARSSSTSDRPCRARRCRCRRAMIVSLGGTAPFRPSTEAGMMVGAARAAVFKMSSVLFHRGVVLFWIFEKNQLAWAVRRRGRSPAFETRRLLALHGAKVAQTSRPQPLPQTRSR